MTGEQFLEKWGERYSNMVIAGLKNYYGTIKDCALQGTIDEGAVLMEDALGSLAGSRVTFPSRGKKGLMNSDSQKTVKVEKADEVPEKLSLKSLSAAELVDANTFENAENLGAIKPPLPTSKFATLLEKASPFGTHLGKFSGRPFSPEELGLPMQKLTTNGVEVTPEGVARVKIHTARFGEDFPNAAMIQRLESVLKGEIEPTFYDINYYTHELREFQHYEALGYKTGVPENPDVAYQLWNNTHTATLEEYGLNDSNLYHPEISGD
jgi:hypothetical protein